MRKQYFSLVQTGQTATINIYGDITSYPWAESDVSAYNLSKQIDEMQSVTEIDVYINSYGGEVAEGLAIYNALKRKAQTAKVVTHCDGFACSIASVIFMAGSERKMSKASLLMIHNAWTWGEGNAEALRKLAEDLDIITGASVEAYKEVATISEKKIRELMNAESWISPKDAKKYGFCTEILDEKAENPSQSVKQALFNIVLEANKTDSTDADEEDEEKPDQEEETAENGGNDGTNDENETKSAENEEETDENGEENPEEEDENADNDEEKPTERLGGFFNAIFKI